MTPEPFRTFFIFVGLIVMCLGAGGAFALGFGLVCRWLGWAPVNLHVHTHIHEDEP